jgi:hypothetical protein
MPTLASAERPSLAGGIIAPLAPLLGALGTFAALAAFVSVTRRVDWPRSAARRTTRTTTATRRRAFRRARISSPLRRSRQTERGRRNRPLSFVVE